MSAGSLRQGRSPPWRCRRARLRIRCSEMKLRRFPLLLAIIVLTTAVPALAELYTDWLWFAHVGYGQVFVKSLGARALLTVLSGVAVFALLGGNLWLALRVLRPRAFMVTTPQGPQALTIDARSIRRLAMGAVGGDLPARGLHRRRGMGDVAVLPERHPVRTHRPRARAGHRLLPVHAAAARRRAQSAVRADAGGGCRHGGRVCARRRSRARAHSRAVRLAPRDTASRRAGGAPLRRARLRRVAADPAAADGIVWQHHRRHLLRCPRAHARVVGARRRRRAERRTGAVAGVHDRQVVADRRRCRPLRGRVGRRHRLCRRHPAVRGRAERAGP